MDKEKIARGIASITQLQKTKISIVSTAIILIGLLCGVVISIIHIKTMWWVLIILLGAFFNTSLSFYYLIFSYKLLKKQENIPYIFQQQLPQNEQKRTDL